MISRSNIRNVLLYEASFTTSSTTHFFFLLIGRHSLIRTVSPNLQVSCSSCAMNFLLCCFIWFVTGFANIRSTRTTTVFFIAVDTTRPMRGAMVLFTRVCSASTRENQTWPSVVLPTLYACIPLLRSFPWVPGGTGAMRTCLSHLNGMAFVHKAQEWCIIGQCMLGC